MKTGETEKKKPTASRRSAPRRRAPKRQAPRRRRAIPVGSMVRRIAAKTLRRRGFADSEIIARWPEIVGAEMGALSLPERITRHRGRDGAWASVLTVRVEMGAALEIQHRTTEILERLAAFCGASAPERLRFVQGPLGSLRAAPQEREKPSVSRGAAAGLKNHQIAEALKNLAASIRAEPRSSRYHKERG